MMPDREKVIAWLNEIVNTLGSFTDDSEQEVCQLAKDTLALLKEQEAVEPTLIREARNKYYNNYVCPRCDEDVYYEQNYCSECGVRFLWEGR